jgi:hypothetical protein
MFTVYTRGADYPFIFHPAYISPLNSIDNRDEYLDAKSRSLKIGASQVSEVVGLGYETANKLYRQKKYNERAASTPMRDELCEAGERTEPIAMKMFVENVLPQIGYQRLDSIKFVKGFMVCTHLHQYLACTPDYFIVDGFQFVGLEIKAPQMRPVPLDASAIPVNHIIQCMQCMYIFGKRSWLLFYYKIQDLYKDTSISLYQINYNQELMDELIKEVDKFIGYVLDEHPLRKFQVRVKKEVKTKFSNLARKTEIIPVVALTSLHLSTLSPQIPQQLPTLQP